jgi:hypothetical protein
MEVVVVLPCIPAMAMPYLRRIKLGQHLGALNDGNLVSARLQHFGIVRGDGGTGDDDRGSGNVSGVVALVDGGAQLSETVGHRATAQVRAGNFHIEVEQDLRDAAHADATDADEVRVLRSSKHRGVKLHFNT